ncbi:15601_t:CDS:1 [Cetraspora pellucida]|uniref:15601_t:CDS:1 n=1 Tax=Cetraspora pellucida TaxID=1433469 RepID=A0A9N8WGH5_9GLOM|nr:15601_t:CDS:1 [Cetraspora pellucida]
MCKCSKRVRCYWTILVILLLFALSYGIIAPLANDCANYQGNYYNHNFYYATPPINCFFQAYAPAMFFAILCILIMIIYGLIVIIKKRKTQIQQGVTDDNNDNQAHEVIIEEKEADLEKDIRMLEKQKRIAELKKEIKDLETVHVADPESITANST